MTDDLTPTEERKRFGVFQSVRVEKDGEKIWRDTAAHAIDDLERKEVITTNQANAARDYEELFRASRQIGGIRDSLTMFEPQGHDSTDGNVGAVRRMKALRMDLGVFGSRLLERVSVDNEYPSPREIERLRIALDACIDFFQGGRK
ncbi:MAG: hypothetical protein AAFR21_11535 [Pseudomonadota bacterium]